MKNIIANEGVNWDIVWKCAITGGAFVSYYFYKVTGYSVFSSVWDDYNTFGDFIPEIWNDN